MVPAKVAGLILGKLMFILSKIIGFFLTPAFWLILLFVWILLARKLRTVKRRVLLALVISWLLMNPFIADEGMRLLEKPMQQVGTGREYAAAIVLGGNMVEYDKQLDRLIFRTQTDRFLQARLLFTEGKVKRIIFVSGPGDPWKPEQAEAKHLYRYLTQTGIPEDAVLYGANSRNTYENVIETKQILERENIRGDLLLVTSASHMRRAVACFEANGIQVDIYPTDKITGPRIYTARHLLLPSIQSLNKWQVFCHEVFGYIAYRGLGYI